MNVKETKLYLLVTIDLLRERMVSLDVSQYDGDMSFNERTLHLEALRHHLKHAAMRLIEVCEQELLESKEAA